MSISEFDAEVAAATGDTVGTVRRCGFSMLSLVPFELEPDDLRPPQVIDWDSVDAGKVLGGPLHDHLIIGMNGKRFSFAESLPDDLRAS